MMAELKTQLKVAPNSPLTLHGAQHVCCFDHLGLSQHVDYMVLMAYDV